MLPIARAGAVSYGLDIARLVPARGIRADSYLCCSRQRSASRGRRRWNPSGHPTGSKALADRCLHQTVARSSSQCDWIAITFGTSLMPEEHRIDSTNSPFPGKPIRTDCLGGADVETASVYCGVAVNVNLFNRVLDRDTVKAKLIEELANRRL